MVVSLFFLYDCLAFLYTMGNEPISKEGKEARTLTKPVVSHLILPTGGAVFVATCHFIIVFILLREGIGGVPLKER